MAATRDALDEVVNTAKRISRRPLIVKLSPNVTSIALMARVAQEAGADAISLVNTFVAMAIDPETRKPRIANVTAGLSGPAIKPIALRMVYDAARAVNIPVIGMGGISTAADIVEFMLAGASAVQIGTASYWDPVATEKIAGRTGNLVRGTAHRAGGGVDRRHGDGIAGGGLIGGRDAGATIKRIPCYFPAASPSNEYRYESRGVCSNGQSYFCRWLFLGS